MKLVRFRNYNSRSENARGHNLSYVCSSSHDSYLNFYLPLNISWSFIISLFCTDSTVYFTDCISTSFIYIVVGNDELKNKRILTWIKILIYKLKLYDFIQALQWIQCIPKLPFVWYEKNDITHQKAFQLDDYEKHENQQNLASFFESFSSG